MRLAAIDVGSNSIHMVVAQADADGAITTLWRAKEMVGLGRISFPSHRLSGRAMDLALETLRRFAQSAQRRQCEKIIAVATSAVREAENGGDFLERVGRQLRLPLRVVSARDEARLIYLGVRQSVDLQNGPHLIIDLGGGSVEFVVADHAKATLLESRKLGAARMTAQFIKSDPVKAGDLRRLLRHFDEELAPLCANIRALGPISAIGTSGTLETLATLCGTASASGNGDGYSGRIERPRLERLLSRLLESRSKDRARMAGLDPQRQDQIVAGAVLLNELFRRLELEELRISRAALREGILVDYLSRHLPDLAIRRDVPDPRRRSVIDLGRRCDWHQTHSEHVAGLCMQLFDQLKPLHGLTDKQRELIEYGALLHDIGWHIAREKTPQAQHVPDRSRRPQGLHRRGGARDRQHRALPPQGPPQGVARGLPFALLGSAARGGFRRGDAPRGRRARSQPLRHRLVNPLQHRQAADGDRARRPRRCRTRHLGGAPKDGLALRPARSNPRLRTGAQMRGPFMDALRQPHNFPGKLIVVEGIDGSGKSTQLQLAMRYLKSRGLPVFFTEWNSADLVKAVTKRGKKKMTLTPLTFSLLHATDFAHRLVHNIFPPLKAGMIVLADRYIFTAFARDAVRGCDPAWLRAMYQFTPRPDLALYFKVPIDVSIARILSGRARIKQYEAGMDLRLAADPVSSFRIFQQRILDEYDRIVTEYGLVQLDATQSIGDQQARVRELIDQVLADYNPEQPTLEAIA